MQDLLLREACETARLIDNLTLVITLARLIKPFELKGDIEAAELVTAIRGKLLTSSAIKTRVKRGVYQENLHFRTNGGKMRLWDREAIIAQEMKFIKDDGYAIV